MTLVACVSLASQRRVSVSQSLIPIRINYNWTMSVSSSTKILTFLLDFILSVFEFLTGNAIAELLG